MPTDAEASVSGEAVSLRDGALRAVIGSRRDVVARLATGPRCDARTRLLLEGPIVATLLRLATPNVLVMVVQASVGLLETYCVATLGTDALAGIALVFPVLMLMQMMSAGAMGGGISSAIARALGAGHRAEAEALVLHALAIAAGLTELIGLCAAAVPYAWLSLFDTDPAMLDAGARYLHVVGPCYGLFGLGMALYFASQGPGRLLWPLLANLTRLTIAAGGGWLALRWSGDLSQVFLALSAALAAFGLINAGAIAGGAWFGRVGWPRMRPARVHRR
jgi:Na+-driven multidrug efflux pump